MSELTETEQIIVKQFKVEARKIALHSAENLQQGFFDLRPSQVLYDKQTEGKASVEEILAEADKIYAWLTKDLGC